MQITVQSAKQNLGIEAAPHLHAALSTNKIMALVLIALLPAVGVMLYYFGTGLIWQFILLSLTGLACELVCALLRGRPLKRAACDLSVQVTALLLALTLPPLMPWYWSVSAMAFAILLVKQAFGGLGMNIFNPAMAGFVFLIVSAPGAFFTTYIAPAPAAIQVATLERTAGVILAGDDASVLVQEVKALQDQPDALSGATFLESVKTARKAQTVSAIAAPDFSSGNYVAYAALGIAYLIGGLFLIACKVILFQMPLAFLTTVAIGGALWHYLSPDASISCLEHLLFGGTMLGAFFIITDPVTNAGTSKGRICFSILCALLLLLIRVEGSYSDSVAFAVLLSNAAAPLIDVLTRRRPFGVGYKEGGLQ
ncbi:MAG: RnfABCDGE type electron transport complex subunit D [Candidatus Anaerobiospirillum merdipullorum]|uniref:Ion-translocating oxidoreductase complex subunit D n=1 Tax=Candidatus Anaerobiospirillum merdipullorum TaxID=2838450 RepID=A0A9E2KPV4_9GAMM|nr:RnfABCDGE type electron transport complex subunit D [Candidatus Anaerobiospirillum merdipullorum]